ncbi:GNAT family N-acetyltransferase [Thalassococcus halodurans]|nr:GNAT family N-acyltransferase [Thalassococcus halodurans]
MTGQTPRFTTRLARDDADLLAAQRLRYDVFVRELGGDGDLVDHDAGLERDAFDPHFDHLLLLDESRTDDQVVGVYRLLRDDQAGHIGRFYSDAEYDLDPLLRSGRKLLELGRSCLHKDYRGGAGMMVLWQALADYVTQHDIDILFGTASFHGTDIDALAHPLSNLHHRHLVSEDLRVRSKEYQSLNVLPEDQVDRRRAVLETPALIKAYLRLGGAVGDGAFVDHQFNTTDVCLIMDTQRLNARQKGIYTKDAK